MRKSIDITFVTILMWSTMSDRKKKIVSSCESDGSLITVDHHIIKL